jgi:hypothetical protein
MTREVMRPLGPRLEPSRRWWVKWVVLAIFAASAAVVPVVKWAAGVGWTRRIDPSHV